jgi:hypothetical protein
MEIKTFEMRELKADKGMVLTNGEACSSVGGSVYLGCNSKPEDWYEITEEEYNEIIKAQETEAEI